MRAPASTRPREIAGFADAAITGLKPRPLGFALDGRCAKAAPAHDRNHGGSRRKGDEAKLCHAPRRDARASRVRASEQAVSGALLLIISASGNSHPGWKHRGCVATCSIQLALCQTLRAGKFGARRDRRQCSTAPVKVRIAEIGADEDGVIEIGVAEIGMSEARAEEIGERGVGAA